MPTISIDRAAMTRVVERRPVNRWFYPSMALVIITISLAGFVPSMIDPSTRNVPLPLTGLVTTHAILSAAWVLLFFCQATLVANGHTALHRRLGVLGAALALAFLVEGYVMAVEAARRGFDLTRTVNAQLDPIGALLTRLGLFIEFGVLVAAAIWCRQRPQVHRRLMLFATVGPLAVAPTTHLVHHWLPPDSAGLIRAAIGMTAILLLFASAAYDRLSRGRIQAVSLWGAALVLAWQVATGLMFPTVAPLRQFATWLIR